jgi:hypothetical protein
MKRPLRARLAETEAHWRPWINFSAISAARTQSRTGNRRRSAAATLRAASAHRKDNRRKDEMTIHRFNNPDGLLSVFMTKPFAIGDTDGTTSDGRDWTVFWRDRTTLMIAPYGQIDEAQPSHIHRCVDTADGLLLVLVPSGEERLASALDAINRASVSLIYFRDQWLLDAEREARLSSASEHIEAAHKDLMQVRGLERQSPSLLNDESTDQKVSAGALSLDRGPHA